MKYKTLTLITIIFILFYFVFQKTIIKQEPILWFSFYDYNMSNMQDKQVIEISDLNYKNCDSILIVTPFKSGKSIKLLLSKIIKEPKENFTKYKIDSVYDENKQNSLELDTNKTGGGIVCEVFDINYELSSSSIFFFDVNYKIYQNGVNLYEFINKIKL